MLLKLIPKSQCSNKSHTDLLKYSSHLPANDHQLPLSGSGPESLPQIHGENGAGTVEDGGEGGHEGRDHHSHH